MEPRTVLAIGQPIYDCPTIHTIRALRRLEVPLAAHTGAMHGMTKFFDTHGVPVDAARRQITADALALEGRDRVTHILWIDDDMVFPPHAFRRLLSYDLPIVGGLCHNRRQPYQPILARLFDPEWGLAEGAHGWIYDYPPDTRIEVDATGGAFLLVKREVFEAISAKFGEQSWWQPFPDATEDFSFCRRARACGYRVIVDTGLPIGHLAEVLVTPEFAQKNRGSEFQRWSPAVRPDRKGAPVASVVIPTFNQTPRLLKAAVFSALAQTVLAEVIVVDDGTTDYYLWPAEGEPEGWISPEKGTLLGRPVLRLPAGVRVLAHQTERGFPQNRGISAALNTGIAAMKTDLFCWLSSDDLFDPQKIELQAAAMDQAGSKCSFHGYLVLHSADGRSLYAVLPEWRSLREQQESLARGCEINGSTVMIRRSVFAELGVFDESFRYGQDYEMWARIGQRHPWQRIDKILGTRREGGNLTAAIEAEVEGSERRARRDEEDRLIRAAYGAPVCPHCRGVLP